MAISRDLKIDHEDFEKKIIELQTATGLVVVADADSYTFLAANTGRVHVLSPVTGNIALTLPVVATAGAGTEFNIFFGATTVVEGDNWIFTNSDSAPFKGGLLFLDEDAGAADGVDTVYADGTDDTLTVVNPAVGTSIHLITDGTSWYVNGQIVSDTIPTFTTTA